MPQHSRSSTLIVCVALLSLILSVTALFRSGARSEISGRSSAPGLLARIEAKGQIDAGYGVYPPYTQEDPNTKQVSGFSVDLIEQIGAQLKCKVVWHRLNWDTMSADLKLGEFDVIADPIFQTIPR